MKFKNASKLMLKILEKHSQREVAEAMGVTVQYVSNIKRGLCGFPATRAARLKALGQNLMVFELTAIADFSEQWRAEMQKGLRSQAKTPKT